MSDKITGYTERTPEGMTTGAGVIYKNFDMADDTVATASAKIVSATKGGVTISIKKEVWNREIDGLPENTKGMHEVESIKPTVKATLAEIKSVDTLSLALGAATVSDSSAPGNYKIVENKAIADSDYLENITIVTQTKTGEPLFIQVLNPLNVDDVDIKTEYKAGGEMELTMTGNYDPTNVNASPIKFYVPVAPTE